MTSPPDVQNVPDVFSLLQQASALARLTGRLDLAEAIDAALAKRDRFVLVPREAVDRIAELEERLMVMCVGQIREFGDEPAAAWRESELAYVVEECKRIRILGLNEMRNALTDLAAWSANRLTAVPSPETPEPAADLAQGVEGEPHHER